MRRTKTTSKRQSGAEISRNCSRCGGAGGAPWSCSACTPPRPRRGAGRGLPPRPLPAAHSQRIPCLQTLLGHQTRPCRRRGRLHEMTCQWRCGDETPMMHARIFIQHFVLQPILPCRAARGALWALLTACTCAHPTRSFGMLQQPKCARWLISPLPKVPLPLGGRISSPRCAKTRVVMDAQARFAPVQMPKQKSQTVLEQQFELGPWAGLHRPCLPALSTAALLPTPQALCLLHPT